MIPSFLKKNSQLLNSLNKLNQQNCQQINSSFNTVSLGNSAAASPSFGNLMNAGGLSSSNVSEASSFSSTSSSSSLSMSSSHLYQASNAVGSHELDQTLQQNGTATDSSLHQQPDYPHELKNLIIQIIQKKQELFNTLEELNKQESFLRAQLSAAFDTETSSDGNFMFKSDAKSVDLDTVSNMYNKMLINNSQLGNEVNLLEKSAGSSIEQTTVESSFKVYF